MESAFEIPSESATKARDELPAYLPRPSSAKSQDVTHILARTFRELFTRDFIAPDTIEYLNTSRCGDNEYHESYVAALQKIKEKHRRQLEEAAMLERHILQAQAQALSADERAANHITTSLSAYPEVSIPPARSHFRSCVDSELLRKHNLISPEDFAILKLPFVPPPKGENEPHYLRETKQSRKVYKAEERRNLHSAMSDSYVDHHPSESEFERDVPVRKSADHSFARLEKNLWKQQMSNDERLMCRADLGNLQDKVNHLKSNRYDPPGDLLIRKNTKRQKEVGIKPIPESLDKNLPIFIAQPSIVTFADYKVGQVYEIRLELKNVTTVMRPVRVIPPKTAYFSVGLGQFPSDNGLIAPGMSCIYPVRFSPDSLCDFDDVLTVESQSFASPLLIPLQGRRPPPVLTVPEVLNVGHCLVGGVKVGQFVVRNEGGTGCFCILPSSCWPSRNYKSSSSTNSFVRVDPFEVKPSTFELNSGQMTILEVLFSPTTLDSFTESFIIVCDNCHVRRLYVTGEAKEPCVELVSVEDHLSEHGIGEMEDVSAQHLIRFPTLVPFIYLQETFTVKNCISVDMAYNWIVVRPHLVVRDSVEEDESNSSVAIPNERVQDIESAFSVEPDSGVLPSGGTMTFTLTFAPPSAMEYNSVLHLVLRYFLRSSSDDDSDQKASGLVPGKSLMTSYLEPKLTETTALEIEVKGKCEPYQVSIEPCIMSIPGQILLQTTLKKSFKISNNSMASVLFSWINVQTPAYLLHVEPTFGEIMPHSELLLELSVTGSEPGKIDHRLECHLSPVDEPLSLQVIAEIKGPELIVAQPDVNFGLVQLGTLAQSALTLKNFSRVSAHWRISEVGSTPDGESEFEFCPASGEVKSLDSGVVAINFRPKCCRSVQSIFEISLSDGFQCMVPVYAEVQRPAVCFREHKLHISDAFMGVPVVHTIVLMNQTLFSTPFKFCQIQGDNTDDFELTIEPDAGILLPRQNLDVSISFTSYKMGEYSGLLLPCSVEGMTKLLCLELSAVVEGLSVSYSVSDDPDGNNRQLDLPPVVNFGADNKIGDISKRFLFIRNNSGIRTEFRIECEHFQAFFQPKKPPTPPEKKLRPGQVSSSQKKLLAKTPNLADPVPKTKEQLHSDLCKGMLQRGKGAAFFISPSLGVLEPFAEVVIEITGFSDMWGIYTDKLICCVDSLELVYIPVSMTVFGCPLYFTMVNPKTDQRPIARFGTHVAGAPPVVRPARIMNTSPVDLRLDWQTYNVFPNDDQFLDLVVSFGDAFPLKDESGQEISQTLLNENETLSMDSACFEHNEIIKPKVISLRLRSHEGTFSQKPFEVRPSQFLIPAFGSRTVDLIFSPDAVNIDSDALQDISCISYALGFMSLDSKDQVVENYVSRPHQYDVSPLRIDLNAAINLGLLTIQYGDDEDNLQYNLAASDLLSENNELQPLYTKESSLTLCNRTSASLEFDIQTLSPFAIVDLHAKTKDPVQRVNKTDRIRLKPQQNALVNVAFCLTPELVEYANLQSFFCCGRRPEGTEFKESICERTLKFERELCIEFAHHNVQKIPLFASLVLPSLELSTELVDFGTCFVGQKREIQLTLSNKTSSKSCWRCSEDYSTHSDVKVFEITPNSGKLDVQKSFTSNNSTVINIFFTAPKAEAYETVYIFEGILGEQMRRLTVKGLGSHDGHYEALVNI